MSFIEPKIRLGNKTMTQDEYTAQRERKRQQNAIRYNSNVRFTVDKQYSDFYKSSVWRRVRKQVLLRDKYMCQSCLRKGIVKSIDSKERFFVHHIVELKDDWELRLNTGNLETVCATCHIESHRATK